MFGILGFGTFLMAGILLNITPGADTMYILGRSISNGKNGGIVSAIGIGTGSLVHTIFAAMGLSILLAESELAFSVVKYLGAAYLIFLGIKTIFKRDVESPISIQKQQSQNLWRIYASGTLTNILNPKVALFFLAFLPQFIDPLYTDPFFSFLLLGVTFSVTGTIWCLILAIFSSSLSTKFGSSPNGVNWLSRITGGVFILLGLKLAFSEK